MNSELTGYSNYSYFDSGNTDDKSDLKKVLIGVLAGAAVGAIVGAAFTEKGKKKTSRIAESTKQLAENLKEKAVSSGVADSLERTLVAAKETVADTIGKEVQNFTSGLKSSGGSTSGNV